MADPNINLTGGETHVSGDIIGGDVHHHYPPEPPREFTPPFQALADLQTFVGREDALQKLATLGAVGVTNPRFLIAGIGGLGKTTLAIHIAHQLRRVFSGGVLWADVPTTEPFSKLDEWARAYEGDVRDFQDLNARADRVRAIIQQRVGRKRVLAILDGVMDESDDAKLAPLLRALSDCAVVVTSRATNLAALYHVRLIPLDKFDADDAVNLFSRFLPDDARLAGNEKQIHALGAAVEFLPFALELLSKQLVKHREWTLADLQRKLAQSRLDALKWGGGTTHEIGIRASFLLSYRGLAAEERKFFDALGAFGGEDFDIAASAAIAQVERAAAEKMLEHLLDLSMAQAGRSAGRYRLHTLMRDFARELCGENLHDAESRMATYYCEHLIETVNDAKSKSDEVIRNFLDIELRNYQFAIDWLIVNLTRERYPLVRDAIDSLDYHLELRGYWQERIANLESALKAANKFGDEFAVARILRRLALALIDIGEWNRAESSLRDAIAKSELLDDFEGLGLAYSDLGNLYGSRGDWRHAIANNELAVTYFRKLDDFYGISRAYSGLGIAYDSKGDLDVAIEYYNKALALLDASDSPRDVAQIYGNLGLIYKDKGNLEKALDYHQKDLAVMQRIGDVSGMAQAKANLANVYRHMGNLEKSIELFEESSEAFEKLNAPQDVASNLINLGGIYADEGAIEKGMQAFERALSIALRLGDELTTAGAYMNIGLLYESIGDLRIAEDWIEKSVALKERLGAPNATEDREYLEALKQKLAPPAEPAE